MIPSRTPMSYELYLQTHPELSTCHLSSATRTTQGLHSLPAPTCSTESPPTPEASPCWESQSLSPTTIPRELDPPYVSSPAPVLSVWSRLPRTGPSHQLGSCHLQPGVAPSLSCPVTLPFPQTLLCSWIYSSLQHLFMCPHQWPGSSGRQGLHLAHSQLCPHPVQPQIWGGGGET